MPENISSNPKGEHSHRAAVAFFVLIAISSLARLLFGLNFRERTSFDTASYLNAARSIESLDFSQYDGRRTPVYPVFLLLGGMDWSVVRWMQCLLGIGIASMLFATTWHRTRSVAASFVVGLLSSLAISELLFEQIIYSETLCTFWLALSLLAYARTNDGEGATSGDYALLGISAALAGMTRPMFLFLGPLYFCFMFSRARRLEHSTLRDARLALVLAPTLVLAIGWSVVNKHTVNYFGVTTTTGYNLSNHSGAFMELAPAQYSEIAQIYLRYRARQIPRMGSQTMTIWLAEKEITRKTALSSTELSKQLTRMSLEMFAQHPILYLESVARAWVRFWGFGFYNFIESYKDSAGGGIAYALLVGFGSWQLLINVTFLIVAAYSIAQWLMGRVSFDFEHGVIAIVLAASLVQALLEYGENARFFAPLVPLAIYTVVTFLWREMESRGGVGGRIRS